MKIEELQGKTHDQLKDMTLAMKKELFNLRFQRATGELTNTARFRAVRRDIARVYTAMNLPEGVQAKAKKEKAPKDNSPKAAAKPAAKKAAKA